MDSSRLDSSRLDSSRLDSSRLDSSRLDSSRLDSSSLLVSKETLLVIIIRGKIHASGVSNHNIDVQESRSMIVV